MLSVQCHVHILYYALQPLRHQEKPKLFLLCTIILCTFVNKHPKSTVFHRNTVLF